MASLVKHLDHPAYHERMKLRGYNCKVDIFSAVSDTDAVKILRQANPEWSLADHFRLAEEHEKEAAHQQSEWSRLADEAAQAVFGRNFRITDYRISGIACEDFPEEYKEKLRFAAHASSGHKLAARVHAKASLRKMN